MAAAAYTRRITALVGHLAHSGLEVTHPLLLPRETTRSAAVLMLTANRGLCGGYNSSILRLALARYHALKAEVASVALEASGKRGIGAVRFRGIQPSVTFTHFEDKPAFDEVRLVGQRYLDAYLAGKLDRLDIAYTKFENLSRQYAVVETLLPLTELEGMDGDAAHGEHAEYEFLPSAASILDEVVPTSFLVKLFKCFLDAAVSEQIARMRAMKSATENADEIIANLSMTYNRARQTQITSEILEVVSGAEALNK
jgi:F-type H+-transporting ATPase subunit gamma